MPPITPSTQDDLMTAYREGLFSDEELFAAAGEDFEALVEKSPETAIRVADALSGVRLYIPGHLTDDSRINEFVHEADAKTVISVYRSEHLKVPRLMSLRRVIRRRRIKALHAAGWSATLLAMHFQLSERQIYSILRRCRQEADARHCRGEGRPHAPKQTMPSTGR